MKNTIINRKIIQRVAQALGELNDEVIYVGGAAVSLYVNDPAADDIRPTKDIDISIKIASLSHLEEIREKLVAKGFKQTADLDVICRFKLDDISEDDEKSRLDSLHKTLDVILCEGKFDTIDIETEFHKNYWKLGNRTATEIKKSQNNLNISLFWFADNYDYAM